MYWPSKLTRRLFLFLTGGLLAKVGLAGTGPVEAEEEPLSAAEILQRMAQTYAACNSYQDSGSVVTVFRSRGGERTTTRPITTAFVRPDRFRFEFQDSLDGQTWRRY